MPGERKRQKLGGPDQIAKPGSKPSQKKAPSSSTRGGTRGESRPSSSRTQRDRPADGNAAIASASTIPSTALAQPPVKLSNHQKFRLQVLVARNTDVPSDTEARQGQTSKVNWAQIHREFVDQFDNLSSEIQDESDMANTYYTLQDENQLVPTAQSDFQDQPMGDLNMLPTTAVRTGTSYPNEADGTDISDEGNDVRARSGRAARFGEPSVAEQVSRISISGDDDISSALRDRDQSKRSQRGKDPQSRTRGVATRMKQSAAGSDSSHPGLGGRDLRTSDAKEANTGGGALSATAANRGSKKNTRNDNLDSVMADMSSDFTELTSSDAESPLQDETAEGGDPKPGQPRKWGFDERHANKVIELRESLGNGHKRAKDAGIWERVAENFSKEFTDFEAKPDLDRALRNLHQANTTIKDQGYVKISTELKRFDGKRFQWHVKHIDFTEDAVARDLTWKAIRERFVEKFPEMKDHSANAVAKGHNKWSYIRPSAEPRLMLWGCMEGGFTPEEKMKLLEVRQQHSGQMILSNEVIRSVREELNQPEVSDEQIKAALTGHMNVPIEELMRRLAHRHAELATQKAKRVERNKNAEKQMADINRKRVGVWIKIYDLYSDRRILRDDAAKQIMKIKDFRELYKTRKAKSVSKIYLDLKRQGVTMQFLQGTLADIDAGRPADALIETIAPIDELGSDSEARNDVAPVGDGNDDTMFVAKDRHDAILRVGQDDGMEGASTDDVDMRTYQQQIQLRARLGGKRADAQEASIEARVHQQQLQAYLDIEILSQLGDTDAIDVINSEAYKNWLQLGDEVPEDEFDKLVAKNHRAVFDVLTERYSQLNERSVNINELQDIAKLDTLHHDYLTLMG